MYVYAMILVDKADKCNFSSIISHVMSIFVFKRLFKLIVKVIMPILMPILLIYDIFIKILANYITFFSLPSNRIYYQICLHRI